MEILEKIKKWLKNWRKTTSLEPILLRSFLVREYSPRELAFLFIVALSVGAFTKSLLNDSLTIGHDDYTLSRNQGIIDLNILEKALIQKTISSSENSIALKGETCTEEDQ